MPKRKYSPIYLWWADNFKFNKINKINQINSIYYNNKQIKSNAQSQSRQNNQITMKSMLKLLTNTYLKYKVDRYFHSMVLTKSQSNIFNIRVNFNYFIINSLQFRCYLTSLNKFNMNIYNKNKNVENVEIFSEIFTEILKSFHILLSTKEQNNEMITDVINNINDIVEDGKVHNDVNITTSNELNITKHLPMSTQERESLETNSYTLLKEMEPFFEQLQMITLHWTKRNKYLFVRNAVLKCNTNLYPTQQEIDIVSLLLHTPKQITWRLFSRARYEKRTGLSIQLNHKSKSIILEWIKKNPNLDPTFEEKMKLVKKTGLGMHQFLTVYSVLKENRGEITDNNKNIIKVWIDQNNRKPTLEERKLLQYQTGLSRTQLNTQIRILNSKKGRVTSQNKKIIKDWLVANGFRSPTSEERLILEQETGLSRDQVSKQILYMQDKSGRITEETKQIIRNWLKENPNKNPTSNDRIILQKETNCSQQQITNLIRSLRIPQGSITLEVKEYIKSWLINNNNKSPNNLERELLMKETNLSYDQLRNLIRRQLQLFKIGKSIIISKEIKEQLKNWLQTLNGIKPTNEEITQKSKEFGLTKEQLYFQIRSITREKKAILSKEIKDQLLQWMKENNFRSPNKDERDQLETLTGLGRMQLNFQLYLIRKKHISENN